jgi:hypothetical protein
MRHLNQKHKFWNSGRQRGAAMAATVIALPVLGALIGGAVQLGLLFEAKSTLNHAVLQAARAGMTNRAETETLATGLVRGLLPLYSPAPDIGSVGSALRNQVFPDVVLNSCLRILNPTREAMNEFRIGRALPNADIAQRSANVGNSGVNVQDANLLKVYAVYGAPLIVPIIGPLFATALSSSDQFGSFEKQLLARNRLPIVSSAIVHMQSRTIENNLMVSRGELNQTSPCSRNLIREFLSLENLGDNARTCLAETGQSAVITGGNCGNCRRGVVRPDGTGFCGACARDLGGIAECFNGNPIR